MLFKSVYLNSMSRFHQSKFFKNLFKKWKNEDISWKKKRKKKY